MISDSRHETFADDMDGSLWRFEADYHGRNFYQGPAVFCEASELQEVIRATTVNLQWDQMGNSGLVVYPARRKQHMVITKESPAGMSILEGAREALVSPAVLYSLANQGKLPGARRIGKRIIIHRETFLRWLADGMGE